MMLVNYHPTWMNLHKRGPLPMLLGGIQHPLYRRQLVGFEMHDERQDVFTVEPWEIMAVNRFHWNGNLQLFLTPHPTLGFERMAYVSHGSPWQVECYSPKGKLVRTITEEDCNDF